MYGCEYITGWFVLVPCIVPHYQPDVLFQASIVHFRCIPALGSAMHTKKMEHFRCADLISGF